jgi:hypothetical protein
MQKSKTVLAIAKHEKRSSKPLVVLELQLSVGDVRRQAAMNSPRPMPARQFVFLKAEKPDAPAATPPRDSKDNGRHQHSHKKRLLFAIKRDLQTAATAVRDTSLDSMQLVDRLEAVRRAPAAYQTKDATALQLSQSVSLIERFVVDQLPQGSSGDMLLAAWNCVAEHSVEAVRGLHRLTLYFCNITSGTALAICEAARHGAVAVQSGHRSHLRRHEAGVSSR